MPHLALRDQLAHRADGLLDRHARVREVQVPEVERVDAEPAQARLRRLPRALGPGVDADRLLVRVAHRRARPRATMPHLVASWTSLAAAGDRARRRAARCAPSAVGVGGVDQRRARVDRVAQRGQRALLVGVAVHAVDQHHRAVADGGRRRVRRGSGSACRDRPGARRGGPQDLSCTYDRFRPMAEIRQLRYFVAVAERGSMSQAALDLHLSQSALSETLRKLEVELGVELLERSSRGVAPTPAGDALLVTRRASRSSRFDAALKPRARRARPAACASASRRPAPACSRPSRRARLLARFPHVRVEPRRFEWGGEVAALREGECDVAFVWLPADLDRAALGDGRRASRASPGSRRATALAARDRAARRRARPTSRSCGPAAHRATGWIGGPSTRARTAREPRWGPENENVEEMLEQVADGSAYVHRPALDDRVLRAPRPRAGSRSPTSTRCASRSPGASATRSPLIAAFADIVRELAA